MAALERADRQTTLGLLVNEVLGLLRGDSALAEAGISFELETHDERRDLVDIVRWLMNLRVLTRVHGDEQQFLSFIGETRSTTSIGRRSPACSRRGVARRR